VVSFLIIYLFIATFLYPYFSNGVQCFSPSAFVYSALRGYLSSTTDIPWISLACFVFRLLFFLISPLLSAARHECLAWHISINERETRTD
jgi:hypothetical protein